ncbi:non-classical secretion pathway, nce2 component [Ophiocordyceps camponoti-floridani]|uniref:Non-classical secretion pathway, nce2 component n=1 Tax=Ophiocordyceps camponoti-floridani TaxID=2030778 RepID=A0A8H4VF45_9HYPO|nr:non-classical secretion pathway, nce2 component [Ophiocordyceps camponoti-floridani]
MVDCGQLISRISALIWVLLATAVIGNVLHNNINGYMAPINFAMFCAALAWFPALYGFFASFIPAMVCPVFMIPLDALAVFFTFVGAVVLSGSLGAPNCGDLHFARHGRHWIGWGAKNDVKRCREIQASTSFLWFLWVSLSFGLIFSIRSAGSLSFRRRYYPRPNMSQVA